MAPADLDELCPDWREREAFISGPARCSTRSTSTGRREGDRDRLHMERFQPVLGGGRGGRGRHDRFLKVATARPRATARTPILVAGEEAGLELPYGCREGICHTCVGTLKRGRYATCAPARCTATEGETIRTCINAPEGPIEIEL